MEVLRSSKDESLIGRDTLDLVSPLAGELDGRLDSLSTSVHGQNHVVAKHLVDLLSPLGEDIVVEGAGAEGQTAGLLGEGLDELGVAVALVDGAVGGQEVEVLATLGIPHVDALSAREDDGERVVVVSGELLLGGDGAVGRGRVESRDAGSGSSSVSVRSHCERFWIVLG